MTEARTSEHLLEVQAMPPSHPSPEIDSLSCQPRGSGPSYTPITPIPVGEGARLMGNSTAGDQPSQHELELELVRLRAAAEAAWLDARAAEIELLLRKMHRGSTAAVVPQDTAIEAVPPQTLPSGWEIFPAATAAAPAIVADFPQQRIEPQPFATQKAPTESALSEPTPREAPRLELTPKQITLSQPALPELERQPPIETQSFAETTPSSTSRRRPAAFVVSLVAHAAVIGLLALVTVSVQAPKDAMSLQVSAAEAEREDIQAVELQPSETPEVASENSLAVAAEAPSDARELVPTEVNLGELAAPPTVVPPGSSLAAMAADGASLSQSLTGDVSTQFFGVSGGGNHFVYLVDSSRSMDDVSRDGFEVARSEVIRAVNQLKPEQRFYVVFFGEQTWSMRLNNPAVDEPTSVDATDENKAALHRWAMTLQMQPGTWPKEALEIAFRLRPDCIFLLTDGEMSQNVIPLIKEQNIVDTLFDGPKPRSIIHTIGFHSPTGEARLREIAKLSNGTYRFVPATGNGRR